MTPRQVDLARHALGLPNRMRMSYRNFFFAGPGQSNFDDLIEMVAIDIAIISRRYEFMGECFRLTRAGAEAVLKPGERLCADDFPEVANMQRGEPFGNRFSGTNRDKRART